MDFRDMLLLGMLAQAAQQHQSSQSSESINLDDDSYRAYSIAEIRKFSSMGMSQLKYSYNQDSNENFFSKFEYARYFFNTKKQTLEKGIAYSIFHSIIENPLMNGDSITFKFSLCKLQVIVGDDKDKLEQLHQLAYKISPNLGIDEKQELMKEIYKQIRSNDEVHFHQFCTRLVNAKKDEIFKFVSRVFEVACIISTIDVNSKQITSKTVDERQNKQNKQIINIYIIPRDNAGYFFFLKEKIITQNQQSSPQQSPKLTQEQNYVEGIENKIIEISCKNCKSLNNVKIPKSKRKPDFFDCQSCHFHNQFDAEPVVASNANDEQIKKLQQQIENQSDENHSNKQIILSQQEQITEKDKLIQQLQTQLKEKVNVQAVQQVIQPINNILKPYFFSSQHICLDASRIFDKGGFASIYKVKIDGKEYAQKLFCDNIKEKKRDDIVKMFGNFFKEIQGMIIVQDQIKSSYILELRGISMMIQQDIFYLTIYTDLQKQNLSALMANDEDISLQLKLNILKQIIQVLDQFSQFNIIHGDIKPQNILLDNNNNVKVSDFGTAKITEFTVSVATGKSAFTPRYSPPELFQGDRNLSTDIWSFGCIAFELFSQTKPWEKEINNEKIRMLAEKESIVKNYMTNNPKSTNLTQNQKYLIENCCKSNYKDRLTTKKIIELLNKL